VNSPRVTEAIKRAAEELMSLSQEEFDKRLEEASKSDLSALFQHAFLVPERKP
jgi:hypothetical protein